MAHVADWSPHSTRRSFLHLAVALIALFSSVSALGVGFAGAVFTDTEAVGANVFTAGTLDLSTAPATALLTAPALAPGDLVTAPLTVQNAGSLQLRYAMSAVSPGALGDELVLRIIAVPGAGDCDAATDFTGAIYDGVLDGGAFGNPAQGAHAGDRTLAGAASEVLCFQVELPLAAPTIVQGETTTAVFTFDAEQTNNN
jgi:hypothetical protein